jgi:RNA polymerase sigma-70 factor (ECF subfamily)
MSNSLCHNESALSRESCFTTTHWSVVLTAGKDHATESEEALEKLCATYWYPLYAFVRRQGNSPEDAQDLTQGFFARLLEKNYLSQVRPTKGKFRCFLLASLKNFLADEWDKGRARKRGGGQICVSFDDSSGEERYRLEPVDAMNAERLFERRWALTVLAQARERLQEEYFQSGKSELYERWRVLDSGESDAPPYAAVASELGLTESAVKSAIFRMRQRYRELVRDEVANTVATASEIDEEIRHLIRVISS